ncbi:MAG: adenylyl-sulfate kinase [Bacteroidia bacterium]|nr:adenylyl-sulfate kinase [Bacteroidia bacterium]HQU99734.1 adenylyl-sulfate kinase [Bacteroidia bacterium]
MSGNANIVKHNYRITQANRIALLNQQPLVLWFTGLSGSGKSTLADALEQRLWQDGIKTYLLDGDNIRFGLNKNVDFSDEGRKENIRRIGEVSKLFVDAGIVVLTAFVSPFIADRQAVRDLLPEGRFVEVFVNTPIEVCEQRDVKGLYKKARAGEITDFTGINSPYEAPLNPEVNIQTAQRNVSDCIEEIYQQVILKIKNVHD